MGPDDALWLNFEPERRGWFVDRNVLDSCDEGGVGAFQDVSNGLRMVFKA